MRLLQALGCEYTSFELGIQWKIHFVYKISRLA